MSDKGKTSTTLSFRCPHDMLEAIDSIGREHYPTDKNSKTNSGCDRSKTLFHIIQAGIASLTDGGIQLEVRQQSKTDSKTTIDQGELEDLVKKLIGENKVIQPSSTGVIQCEDLIRESIADGDIGEAIASSYAATMGNFNGLVEELQDIKSQLQELQLTPPAVPCSLLPVTNDQLPIPNDQLPMINEQIPELNKSQVQNIRTTLKRKNITASAEQIRKTFMDAGWDGDNWEESRNKAIEILIIPLSEYN